MSYVRAVQWSLIATCLSSHTLAQSPAPSGPSQQASAPAARASEPGALDRVQRQADRVFEMILKHGDRPRQPVVSRPLPAPSPSLGPGGATLPPRPVAPAPIALPPIARRSVAAGPVASVGSAPSSAPTSDTALTSPLLAASSPTAAAVVDVSDDKPASAPSTVVAAAPMAAPERSARLELLSSVEPSFPDRLVRSLGSGSVVVLVQVGSDGIVSSASIARSSHPGLERAAQEAVRAWRFKPPGEPASVLVELKFE